MSVVNQKYNALNSISLQKGPFIKDISANFRLSGCTPSPCLLKSTSEHLLFGHFLYPPPSPIEETSFMNGPKGIDGQEDCLLLNIYVPEIAIPGSKINTTKLPVMVWIHGGSFAIGSGKVSQF